MVTPICTILTAVTSAGPGSGRTALFLIRTNSRKTSSAYSRARQPFLPPPPQIIPLSHNTGFSLKEQRGEALPPLFLCCVIKGMLGMLKITLLWPHISNHLPSSPKCWGEPLPQLPLYQDGEENVHHAF